MKEQAIEERAAKLLLKRGVKVPVTAPLFLRIFGKKTLNIVITAPTSYTLLLIAEKYLSLRIKDTKDLTISESLELFYKHSSSMCQIVAMCILNDSSKMWRKSLLTNFLQKRLTPEELSYLFNLIIVYGGVEDFINTIRSIEAMRITKPMNLSPKEKTS